MIKTCCIMLNTGQTVDTILVDLSKSLDTINQKTLLNHYDLMFSIKKSISFIQSYFTNRY